MSKVKVLKQILGYTLIGISTGLIIALMVNLFTEPDVQIIHAQVMSGDELVASTECGYAYFASHKATRADFQLLLQKSAKACKDEAPGTETDYRNQDGSLKHTVIIGDEDTVRTKGSIYDTCIINWELDPVTAFAAFENICLERKF